jgi:FkbM family methyltransferase
VHALTQGWQHQQAGRLSQAEQVYRRVLAEQPLHADALYLLGTVCLRQGKAADAVAALRRLVQLHPDHADAHSNLGAALAAQGQLADAVEHFRQALRLDPGHADAGNNLGLALLQQERFAEAEEQFRQALRLEPHAADLHHHLGLALNHLGRHDEAVACWREVLRLRPHDGEVLNCLGVTYAQQERYDKAAACLRQALRLQPLRAEVHNNLGLALGEQYQLDDAVACFREALRLRPDFADAWNNLGLALAEQHCFDEAAAALEEALRLQPDLAKAHNNLGLVRVREGRPEAALPSYDKALWLEPDYPEAHKNRGLALLTLGDFARGWPEYEWRWRCKEFKPRPYPRPRWDGLPPEGRTLLVHAEQGLGDTLQFVRYLPLLRRRGARVLFECPTVLHRLLAGFPGADRLLDRPPAPEEYDFHVPLLSLPGLFGTDLSSIPAEIPYLAADPALVEQWRRELAGVPGFKVGIVWQGSPKHRTGWHRNIPLTHFAALARLPGVRLYSLQKGAGVEQLAEIAGQFEVVDFGDRLDEAHGAFMDSAALMKNLDLVVTLDTSLAHLAGALGVPVGVALPLYSDWRWLRDRDDSPWYPTMRLFRQTRQGDWAGVFEQIAGAVREGLDRMTPASKARPGNKVTRCRHGTMVYPPHDRYVGRSLELYGEFSESEVALFRGLVRPGDTVLDVGANVGAHTLPLARLVGSGGRVVAFEPQRLLFYCLCANVVLNDLTNVDCRHAAVGQTSGTLDVPELDYTVEENFGGVGLGGGRPAGPSYPVPLVRIDDVPLDRCDLMKIDVEGMEREVLAGAVATIRRHRPFLYVEDDRHDRSAELRALLCSLGYELYRHHPPLFNPANFFGRPENVFGNIVSGNLYGHPSDRPLGIDLHEFHMQRLG